MFVLRGVGFGYDDVTVTTRHSDVACTSTVATVNAWSFRCEKLGPINNIGNLGESHESERGPASRARKKVLISQVDYFLPFSSTLLSDLGHHILFILLTECPCRSAPSRSTDPSLSGPRLYAFRF